MGHQREQAGHAATASDEAIEWLARLRASDVTDSERADFAQWLDASANNKAAFDDASTLWYLLGSLPMPQVATTKPAPRYRPQRALAAAACVLVTCLVFVMQIAGVSHDVMTIKGEQRRVSLDDGSTVHLNTDSHITIEFSDELRRVVLHRGEVWFDVHKQPERPFVVEGAFASAQAVGTAFTVREALDFTQVQVTEGTVAVTPDSAVISNPAYLREGEQSTVSRVRNHLGEFDPDASLAWRRGQVIYQDVTIAEMLADLNRYLPKTMTVNDDVLLQTRVSAALTLEDQEGMLDALSHILPIRWKSVSDNLIIITKA